MSHRLDLVFLFLASLCLVAGVLLGIAMGVGRDFAPSPVHAHLNLLGWASLALYGLAHRAFPELAGSRARAAHLAVSGGSGVLFPAGLWLELQGGGGVLVAAGALGWLAGALLFAGLVGRALLTGRCP